MFNKEQLEIDLVQEGVFAEVESIEIGKNRLTVIGKDTNDFSLMAFQGELIKEGNELYFPNPNNPELPNTTFAKHSCVGASCSSCSFLRSGNGGIFSKITGCQCESGGTCNHTVSAQDPLDTVIDIAVKVLALLK